MENLPFNDASTFILFKIFFIATVKMSLPYKTWYLSDCYNAVYRSVLLLGANVETDSLRKRITSCLIMIAGMMLYWYWEACLISYFAVPTKTLPYNNLEEFLSQSDDKVT